jgi:hypothetical protein
MFEYIADGKLSAKMEHINVSGWFKTHSQGLSE